MKEVEATLHIQVFVNCPGCGAIVDLMDADDTNGYDHNEDCHVVSQACPDGNWIDEHKNFSIEDVSCSECKADFNVKGLNW